jgi:hypothetical protein
MAEIRSRVSSQQLAALTRTLRQTAEGKELLKQLRKDLRRQAQPMVPAVRSSIRGLPSRGESRRRGRKSLRAEMARAVTLQVKTSGRGAGISVFMSPKKMPDGKKGLPGYFERIPGKERLRHPVFGNREVWVQAQNVPPGGYFTRTVRPAEARVRAAIETTVNDLVRRIEDG